MQCPTILSTITPGEWFLLLAAIGNFVVALVIYCEWEGSRLDRFLKDAGTKNRKRKMIFAAYCGLNCRDDERGQKFKELLGKNENSELKDRCDDNIRLFSRVGARLPLLPPWRNVALDWHVVVFLWEILGPYVEERRRNAGPTYAVSFLKYALASVKHLLKQQPTRKEWTIGDPALDRNHNVVVPRKRLVEMQKELETSLASK